MAASVARTARSFGVDEAGIGLLERAHALGMAPRVAALDDDHHPLYLHPGRTVLILLRDAEVRDATVLAAACVTESEDGAFAIAPPDIQTELGEDVATFVSSLPRPGTDTWVEDLVLAPQEVRLVVLAERLDHLRHAHLRGADDAWNHHAHAQAGAVYLPVAERTHPTLATRYRHWHRTFARRLGSD